MQPEQRGSAARADGGADPEWRGQAGASHLLPTVGAQSITFTAASFKL